MPSMAALAHRERPDRRVDSDATVACARCGRDVPVSADYRMTCPECGYAFE